jgi:hypothetical protein
MVLREEMELNANWPIDVTVFGIVIPVMPLEAKAMLPSEVTPGAITTVPVQLLPPVTSPERIRYLPIPELLLS